MSRSSSFFLFLAVLLLAVTFLHAQAPVVLSDSDFGDFRRVAERFTSDVRRNEGPVALFRFFKNQVETAVNRRFVLTDLIVSNLGSSDTRFILLIDNEPITSEIPVKAGETFHHSFLSGFRVDEGEELQIENIGGLFISAPSPIQATATGYVLRR